MAFTNNYLTAEELVGIAEFCDALEPLWKILTSGPRYGISVDMGYDAPFVYVYDSNGEKVGTITWADSGPAFYPGNQDE